MLEVLSRRFSTVKESEMHAFWRLFGIWIQAESRAARMHHDAIMDEPWASFEDLFPPFLGKTRQSITIARWSTPAFGSSKQLTRARATRAG
jgi:hypothetical protein